LFNSVNSKWQYPRGTCPRIRGLVELAWIAFGAGLNPEFEQDEKLGGNESSNAGVLWWGIAVDILHILNQKRMLNWHNVQYLRRPYE
jgi:hypothetical protein